VIRELTNRLSSKKIETRWANLLAGINWTPEETTENDIYIQSQKHKHSTNYSDLYDY